jgi:hypothetical protein
MTKRKIAKIERVQIDAENDGQLTDFEAFRAKYHGREHSGRMHWFDATSGEGMVKLDDGTALYCHFTSVAGIDKNGYHYPTAEDVLRLRGIGRKACKVVPYISPGYIGCEIVSLLE